MRTLKRAQSGFRVASLPQLLSFLFPYFDELSPFLLQANKDDAVDTQKCGSEQATGSINNPLFT